MSAHAVILATAGSEAEASHIAHTLVDRRLVACVNIVSGVRSIYLWRGTVHDEPEWMLIAKTRRDRFEAVREAIRSLHSYEQPEIVAIDMADADAGYLRWIDEVVTPGTKAP